MLILSPGDGAQGTAHSETIPPEIPLRKSWVITEPSFLIGRVSGMTYGDYSCILFINKQLEV